jgi:hypothetical protein
MSGMRSTQWLKDGLRRTGLAKFLEYFLKFGTGPL